MGGCNAITYHNVTPTVFNCLKQILESHGIPLPPGNEGDIEGDTPVGKIKGHFKWDGASELIVTIISKPFIISCGKISGTVDDVIHNCSGNIKEDYRVYEEKFAKIKDDLSKDPAAMQAFFGNPHIMLDQAGIPHMEHLITQYQSVPETEKIRALETEDIKIITNWWGLDFIMSEELTRKIINNEIESEALAGLIGAAFLAVGISAALAAAVGAAFAAILFMKYLEIKFAENGKGVHWPITWAQWAALILPPWDIATLTVKGAVLIHPLRN